MPSTIQPQTRKPMSSDLSSNIPQTATRYVDAAEFRRLIVSTRRMERADKMAPKMRGLRDLETGELFLTEERWLIDGPR